MLNSFYKTIIFVSVSAIFLFSAACSKQDNQSVQNSNEAVQKPISKTDINSDFEKAYQAAEKSRLEAGALNYEWRETENILKAAKEASAKGDHANAMLLVNKAHQQAKLAIEQANTEALAWKDRVIK